MNPRDGDDTPGPSSPANDTTAADAGAAPRAGGAAEMPDPSAAPAASEPARLGFGVVGIGASAGGLEPLEQIAKKLRADRMAFVVVQHMAPGHVSMLGDILARSTTLPVVTVTDGMRLEPSRIYVAPAGAHLIIEGNTFRFAPGEEDRRPAHTIDSFFRTLAAACGSTSIGVLLSGTGTDGTLGLKAIKDEGGFTLAQEPSSAAQGAMPQSAIDAGVVDIALTPPEIGDELVRLSGHPYVKEKRPARALPLDAMARIFAELRRAYDVDFAQYKPGTVERRVARRMALLKVDDLEAYTAFLTRDPHELKRLYGDLLIGVTSFFRDADAFRALEEVVFPRLVEGRKLERPIRIWVAGCATGEEAYSVGITLLEFLAECGGSYKAQIFATDIDEDALAHARVGVYPASIELDIAPDRLRRFFLRTDTGYQVARQLRDLVVFARHNLGKDAPFSHLDLVSCRNVLIYLQPPLQRRVLRTFHYALNPEGFLLLGTSESAADAGELFSAVDQKIKLYTKKGYLDVLPIDFGYPGRTPLEGGPQAAQPGVGGLEPRPAVTIAALADRRVLDTYAPPGVLVDEKLDVLQFRGRTGPFLEPAPGAATFNLLKLVRPEMLVALRATVAKAMSDGAPASSPPVPIGGPGGPRAIALDVLPLADSSGRKGMLVLFRDVAPAAAPSRRRCPASRRPRRSLASRRSSAS